MTGFADFVATRPYVVVDGALATELEARGCDLNSALWSAETLIHKPELIYQVHLDYFLAGADVAITSSYQASVAGLQQHGMSDLEARDLIKRSVELAKQAKEEITRREPGRECWVAGSVGPYGAFLSDGSEYTGKYRLTPEEMKHFHRSRVSALVEAGVDVLAFETIPSVHEAQHLLELVHEFPPTLCWFSFTLRDENHLSDGTPISKVLSLLNESPQVVAVGVNCIPEDLVSKAKKAMSTFTTKPLIAYPNSGEVYDAVSKTWSGQRAQGKELDAQVKEWYALGGKLIGGCCRTTPDSIRTVKKALQEVTRES
ncbi:homocysteine S-methyltransferase [Venturia nashicola]|uniref:Homocysteine S-methyltransferase n=1 Tax=Venturia nashicola TaxID=86259 RepID=A0A4Z1PA29_9PEZI|nr:homocysteine S-methyltransferase [Venturia nashicola]TLD34885.1 homocysteine S-methyltransferase [Venturia nashicola]